MTTKHVAAALCVLLLLSVSRCMGPSCRPRSFAELLNMEMFPEQVTEAWQLDGSPTSAFAPRGYIHAVYDRKDRYCNFKVWIIDKCGAKGAEDWLDRLLEGGHTPSSIAPFPPGYAEDTAYYAAFAPAPVTVKNRPLYERVDEIDEGLIQYAVYFAYGRFVVGGENILCQIDGVERARREFLPILDNLDLSE
ncbi:MAG: hypothetical protein JSV41_00405 [Gemmatimonadota bacterium]|nr:MAG: hypothetical protein JSV41_00405 [Gemmatimonadota bacterium]